MKAPEGNYVDRKKNKKKIHTKCSTNINQHKKYETEIEIIIKKKYMMMKPQ